MTEKDLLKTQKQTAEVAKALVELLSIRLHTVEDIRQYICIYIKNIKKSMKDMDKKSEAYHRKQGEKQALLDLFSLMK